MEGPTKLICANVIFKTSHLLSTHKETLPKIAHSDERLDHLSKEEVKNIVRTSLEKIEECEETNTSCDAQYVYQCLARMTGHYSYNNLRPGTAKIIADALLDKALDYQFKGKTEDAKAIYQSLTSNCTAGTPPYNEAVFRSNNVNDNLRPSWRDYKNIDFIRAAAKSDRKVAQFRYAQMLENGEGGVDQDSVKAMKYYEKSAKLGYQPAIEKMKGFATQFTKNEPGNNFDRGLKSFRGSGATKDTETAFHFLGLAVKERDIRALGAFKVVS